MATTCAVGIYGLQIFAQSKLRVLSHHIRDSYKWDTNTPIDWELWADQQSVSSLLFTKMPSSPKRFRINSKNYFLTYPKCSITKEEVLSQILNLSTPTNKKFIKIARELHENGEPHIHVLIQFEGKYQCKNCRFFDLVSPTRSTHFHPNTQGAKSSSDVKSYVDKDGDTLEWGEFQIDGRSARGGCQTANDSYAKALNAGSVQGAERRWWWLEILDIHE